LSISGLTISTIGVPGDLTIGESKSAIDPIGKSPIQIVNPQSKSPFANPTRQLTIKNP